MVGFSIPGAIEAESLVRTALATSGGVWAQDMGQWEYGEEWSNRAALFWYMDGAGQALALQLPSPAAGSYDLTARVAAGPGFGVVQFELGGAPLGAPVDLYAPRMTPRQVSLGTVTLSPGSNPLTVRVTGKNSLSTGFNVGIDAFLLAAHP